MYYVLPTAVDLRSMKLTEWMSESERISRQWYWPKSKNRNTIVLCMYQQQKKSIIILLSVRDASPHFIRITSLEAIRWQTKILNCCSHRIHLYTHSSKRMYGCFVLRASVFIPHICCSIRACVYVSEYIWWTGELTLARNRRGEFLRFQTSQHYSP